MPKFNSKELRRIDESAVSSDKYSLKRNNVYLVLDNIFDTYNIGGLFRLADALAVKAIYLCAGTATPPNNRIHKASCGTYKVVPWQYFTSASLAIDHVRQLEAGRATTIAVEQAPDSVPYTKITIPNNHSIVLVPGNETTGVMPETLKKCDFIAEIPMHGINKSLNVIVSTAIVAYRLIH